jgi:putative hydrolase of the HAD superfamily
MKKDYRVIGFDADDTLWINETYFRDTEHEFSKLLKEYMPSEDIINNLFNTEIKNLDLYGFGIKGFTLSMIETAIRISDGKVSPEIINKIIELGKELHNKPVELIEDIKHVLSTLRGKGYKLIVATKGDLIDQERKLRKSELGDMFHHFEVMSDKKESDYRKLLQNINTSPDEFLMIGNSLKSDVIPVINIGAQGVHIPFHTTWQHEMITPDNNVKDKVIKLNKITEVIDFLTN